MYALALDVPLDVDDAIAAVYAVVIATSRVSVYALAVVNVEASPVVIAVALVAIAVVLVAISAVLELILAVKFVTVVAKADCALASVKNKFVVPSVILSELIVADPKLTPLPILTFFNVIVLPS